MFNVLIFIIGAGIMFYMGLRSVLQRRRLQQKGQRVEARVAGTVQSRDGAAYLLEFETEGGADFGDGGVPTIAGPPLPAILIIDPQHRQVGDGCQPARSALVFHPREVDHQVDHAGIVDRHTAGPDTRMFEHVFESTARFDDCHVLCLRTSVTVRVSGHW